MLKNDKDLPSVSFMEKKDKVKYWLKTADQDWKVANHLFEKKDYSYALFFGHLTIEKILKAIFTNLPIKRTKLHHFHIIRKAPWNL